MADAVVFFSVSLLYWSSLAALATAREESSMGTTAKLIAAFLLSLLYSILLMRDGLVPSSETNG